MLVRFTINERSRLPIGAVLIALTIKQKKDSATISAIRLIGRLQNGSTGEHKYFNIRYRVFFHITKRFLAYVAFVANMKENADRPQTASLAWAIVGDSNEVAAQVQQAFLKKDLKVIIRTRIWWRQQSVKYNRNDARSENSYGSSKT